jgi:hypothetical protein
MMNLADDIYPTLESFPWMTLVGKSSVGQFDFDVNCTASSQIAKKLFYSNEWADAKTEAQGDLTGYLAKHHYSEYGSHWNNLAKQSRMLVEKSVSAKLTAALENNSLPSDMIQPMLVDINRAALEIAYRRKFPKAPVFFTRLLKIYEAGHLPCGWTGEMSDWPSGMLIIF